MEPEGIEQFDYPRTYRPSWKWAALLLLSGVLCLACGAFTWWVIANGNESTGGLLLVAVVLFCFTLGAGSLFFVLRYRVVLEHDSLHISEWIRPHILAVADIEGWKTIPSTPVQILLVARKGSGLRSRKITLVFPVDDALAAWIGRLPNLDMQEQQRQQDEILESEEHGFSEAQRLEALVSARQTARWLNTAGYASFAWGFFYPHPYSIAIACLIALPWIAVVAMFRHRGLLRADGSETDVYPNVGAALLFPGMTVLIRAVLDIDLVSWSQAAGPAAVVASILLALMLKADAALRASRLSAALGFVFLLSYGGGAVAQANVLLDESVGQVYESSVVTTQIASSKYGLEHKLTLAPWGSQTKEREVIVSESLFNSTEEGDSVCVRVLDGAIGIPWFYVRACSN